MWKSTHLHVELAYIQRRLQHLYDSLVDPILEIQESSIEVI